MILNLTQHAATGEQIAAGVVDLPADAAAALRQALTFETLPAPDDIEERAEWIAALAAENASAEDRGDQNGFATEAMIGGAPWLMGPLTDALQEQGINAVFAFSVREVEEREESDGSVRKVAVFRHAGFVPARRAPG